MTVDAPHQSGKPISAKEFDTLAAESGNRYEIEDGSLLVTGRPAPLHTRVIARLAAQLDANLPPGLEAFPELETELSGRSPRRVPDLVVTAADVDRQPRVRADQIVLAVEIASSGATAVRDYAVKAGEYAANGIAHYWVVDIVDPAAPGLTVYTLDALGEYRIAPRATGVVQLAGAVPMTIDLPALTARR